MFRHYRVIFRELAFITSPSYIIISIAAVGNTVKLGSSYSRLNKIFKTLVLLLLLLLLLHYANIGSC